MGHAFLLSSLQLFHQMQFLQTYKVLALEILCALVLNRHLHTMRYTELAVDTAVAGVTPLCEFCNKFD